VKVTFCDIAIYEISVLITEMQRNLEVLQNQQKPGMQTIRLV